MRILIAAFALALVAGVDARAEPVSGDLPARIEASMKRAEQIAVDTSFPKANTVAEIAKAIREVVYSEDFAPQTMLTALDQVSATPLSDVAETAVREVRAEIVYAG